jgi:uncharacterized phage protein (TIGR01671 family)
MRELKFRVYIPDHEKFCYFTLGNFDYSDRYLYQHKYPVQQYTGLQDKHGKDIYEGDIVSGICLNDGPQICVVGFDTFGIFYTKIKYYPCEEWDNVAMLAQEHNEVIGNIFENSELLNQ